MTSIVWALIAVAVVTGAAALLADACGARQIAALGEPMTLALLVAAGVCGRHGHQAQAWLVAALVFATAATVCGSFVRTRPAAGLAPQDGQDLERSGGPRRNRIEAAIGGQLALSMIALALLAVAMQRHRTDDVAVVFGLVLVLLAVFAVGYRVIAGAEASGGAPLAVAVTAYLAALGSMVVLGVGTASVLIAYASLVLAVSHLTFARHHLVMPRVWAPAAVTASSQGALIALMIGLLH